MLEPYINDKKMHSHTYGLPELPLREHEQLLGAESNQSRPGSSSATPSNTFDFSAYDMNIDAMLPPPGEEGFTVSHVRDEVTLYKQLEQITIAQPRRVDTHDHSECIAHQVADWASQHNNLTDALLRYKADYEHSPLSDDVSENLSIEVVDIFGMLLSIVQCLHS
ncbi:uncharacterized protein EDB93DRAFT_1247790 [Suillus bovinus]|uniref:uncharacterized protein n=1 Tax=Suillus bovinus TaxID=48563 RepID=UPI001B8614F4|nr:uncharacterized protein EDB93DRAFT_1247790 [Suillus bovinus]KAG2155305.1 hypothetical protein EDB93DRAFT_1247790 [Suillus bovinus]